MDCIRFYFCIVFFYLNLMQLEGFKTMDCECGVSKSELSNRIVGGVSVEPHKYPWLVEITLKNMLHCGGSLINDRYVLTAGHCIKWFKKKDMEIVLGRHDRTNKTDGIVMKVESMIIHNDFKSFDEYDHNDIALLKLNDSVTFTEDIMPICLPHPNSDFGGHSGFVIGWGRIHPHSKQTSNVVLKGDVNMLHDSDCKASTIGFGFNAGNICAYNDNIDACQGDSGSPLLFQSAGNKYQVIGVVSWGLDCATKDAPGVYAKVGNYIKWILSNTLDAKYCKIK